MKVTYNTLVEAIQDLQKQGYTEDYNLCDAGVEHTQRKHVHEAANLKVVKYYRFEGMSNPDDNSVLYVIETTNGEKGLLLDAYGVYSGNVSKEMMEKLKMV